MPVRNKEVYLATSLHSSYKVVWVRGAGAKKFHTNKLNNKRTIKEKQGPLQRAEYF